MPPQLRDAYHVPVADGVGGRPAERWPEKSEKKPSARQPLVWSNIVLLALYHGVAVGAVLKGVFGIKMYLFMYIYSQIGGFGVTGGVHRLWSHRAYKARRPLRVLLALCFSVAGQNTIVNWVRDHRVHHKFTETDADPHNALRGFFFAHAGWLLMRKHPEVYRQGGKVDLEDVKGDPVVQWHMRNFTWLKVLFCLVVPVLVPVLGWGEHWFVALLGAVVRLVYGINMSWLVNSAAHLYGTHPYDKRINPTENAVVSFLSLGEGWHNYHHIFPWDYKAAEHRYHLNITTYLLDLFARIGWAYDLKSASPDLVSRVAIRHGDGSHPSHPSHPSPSSAASEHAVADHFREVPYDDYMRIVTENDVLTGVRELVNVTDVTRRRAL